MVLRVFPKQILQPWHPFSENCLKKADNMKPDASLHKQFGANEQEHFFGYIKVFEDGYLPRTCFFKILKDFQRNKIAKLCNVFFVCLGKKYIFSMFYPTAGIDKNFISPFLKLMYFPNCVFFSLCQKCVKFVVSRLWNDMMSNKGTSILYSRLKIQVLARSRVYDFAVHPPSCIFQTMAFLLLLESSHEALI